MNEDPLDFEYIIEDGEMIGLEAEREIISEQEWISSDRTCLIAAMMAFIPAQNDYKIFPNELSQYLAPLNYVPFQNFEFELAGVSVSYTIEYSGYTDTGEFLQATTGENLYYHMKFRMIKVENE